VYVYGAAREGFDGGSDKMDNKILQVIMTAHKNNAHSPQE